MENLTMDKIVNVCKQYGFIFQGSEIYGGYLNASKSLGSKRACWWIFRSIS